MACMLHVIAAHCPCGTVHRTGATGIVDKRFAKDGGLTPDAEACTGIHPDGLQASENTRGFRAPSTQPPSRWCGGEAEQDQPRCRSGPPATENPGTKLVPPDYAHAQSA
jgi:hypothetical protein